MKITRSDLNKAVEKKIISQAQAQHLLEFLNKSTTGPRFNFTNVLYYFGGLIAIGAMTLFMNLGWELLGGLGIVFLTLCYALLGLALAHKLDNHGYVIPAGICATFVICLIPLGIYGFQQAMGWWPPDNSSYQDYHLFVRWNWLFMELGTLAVGVTLAWIYRYPFMVMPIAITLWYMSMDLTPWILGGQQLNAAVGAKVSLCFGLLILALALWVDFRSRSVDYAFWLYLVGVMAFWSGLSFLGPNSEWAYFFFYCGINILLIVVGVILDRKVFVIFGALGVCFYLSHLAYQTFKYSYLFPVALTAIGFGIIYLGIVWQKNEARLTQKMRLILPHGIQQRLQSRDDLN